MTENGAKSTPAQCALENRRSLAFVRAAYSDKHLLRTLPDVDDERALASPTQAYASS